jgi:hypothetical protein
MNKRFKKIQVELFKNKNGEPVVALSFHENRNGVNCKWLTLDEAQGILDGLQTVLKNKNNPSIN